MQGMQVEMALAATMLEAVPAAQRLQAEMSAAPKAPE